MYRVKLHQFEGPLDLLLFFIRRDELDIYDIPIASIADEFLEYVRLMQEVDLDVAGDFVYFASLLVNIKARMLLPSTQVNDGGDPIDPRQELIERLLEYVRFKEAAGELVVMGDRRADKYTRGAESAPRFEDARDPMEDMVNVTVFDLMGALRRVLTDAPSEIIHEIQAEEYTLDEQILFLRAALIISSGSSFIDIVRGRSRSFIITTFLAILEMARVQELEISMDADPTDFHLSLTAEQPPE